MALTLPERRVPPGGGIVIGIILGILLWLSLIGIARAQDSAPGVQDLVTPPLQVFVDSAGISRVEPGIYITWVYAKATATSLPSSGVLVMWNCDTMPRQVKRIAQVVFSLTPDSTNVVGMIEEVDRPWQDVTNERMADMVCRVGPEHDGTATHPWYAPGKPRSDS